MSYLYDKSNFFTSNFLKKAEKCSFSREDLLEQDWQPLWKPLKKRQLFLKPQEKFSSQRNVLLSNKHLLVLRTGRIVWLI